MELFDKVSYKGSKMITKKYSTSFSLGISLLNNKIQDPIYAIYGFVRFADEIVDTFHQHNQEGLLKEFREDTYKALDRGISLNPVLHAFQDTVNKYNIDRELIDCFLKSMEMDLHDVEYDQQTYKQYILGSAEVVGLMCLKVFCLGNQAQYDDLKDTAMALGSAFQKINFLRDLRQDYLDLGRTYFPSVDFNAFSDENKKQIEADIEQDFSIAKVGVMKLPKESRFGVYLAYIYYYKLFNKIQALPSNKVMESRIRIPNSYKFYLLMSSYLKHNLNLL
jgi:phytoene synthase